MSPFNNAIQAALEHVVPRIQAWLKHDRRTTAAVSTRQPYKLLLSGLQGSGKSTWATALAKALKQTHGYKVVVVSLDDFYHTHDALVRIRDANASNQMLRTRGQPGTHDEALAQEFFASFAMADHIEVPVFDKSLFDGQGDRVPRSEWYSVSNEPPVDVLIFEGWCVGFSALSETELERQWRSCQEDDTLGNKSDVYSTTTLKDHALEHVQVINDNLKRYNETFMDPGQLQYLIHLDTEDLANVYCWRLDQEHALLASRGHGMTDEAVVAFVRGYMPAYELYLGRLKTEAFIPHGADAKTQLRIVLDVDRNVIDMSEL